MQFLNIFIFLFIFLIIYIQSPTVLSRPYFNKRNSLGRGIDLRRLPYRFIPFYSSSNNLINNGQRYRRSQPLLPPLIVDQITNDDFNLEPFIISTWEDGKKKRKR